LIATTYVDLQLNNYVLVEKLKSIEVEGRVNVKFVLKLVVLS